MIYDPIKPIDRLRHWQWHLPGTVYITPNCWGLTMLLFVVQSQIVVSKPT